MSNAPHILVIDDELQIQRAIRTILTEKQFRVSTASRGEEGLALAASTQPDLVILDLGLPDMDGVEVCTRLREWTQTPIIILSVRDSEREKVMALDMGADDYLTKPFGIEELLARVRVALRHATNRKGEDIKLVKAGSLTIDLVRHIVRRGDEDHRRGDEASERPHLGDGRPLADRHLQGGLLQGSAPGSQAAQHPDADACLPGGRRVL